MQELWILCVALDPLKLSPHMKFHFNSTVELELLHLDRKSVTGQKKCDVTYGQTDGQTDGRTDGQTDAGEVIPKCQLCLQQVTQKRYRQNPCDKLMWNAQYVHISYVKERSEHTCM